MEGKGKQWVVAGGLIIVIVFIGITYAFINQTLTGTKRQVITAGNLELELKEGEAITINNAMPMYDEVGMIQDSYDFALTNKTAENTDYTLSLKDVTTSTDKLDTSIVKYGLTKDEAITKDLLSNLENNVLDSGTLPGNGIINYSLRLWIDSSVEDESLIKDRTLSYRIEVSATLVERQEPSYVDATLNGCDPVLGDNLVPVTIANDGTVTMANTSEAWYDYTNKTWANAVVLEDTAGTYNPGDVIPENDIESYFVWIPRYKYKIFNDGNYTENTSLNPDAPQTIEIEFESKNTPPSNGTTKDEWLSHPAFQAFDTNGFWVGKFESGYRGATTKAEAQVNAADATKLVIKPNTYSWRNNTVGNMFKTSYEYLRDNESHMMKNTEWGAVAYLSHSQYGMGSEIYINNNTYLTGCGGDSASAAESSTCMNAYGSKVDGVYNQTTTGNISGVFDMSGGAWEYVMGYNTSVGTGGGSSGITSLYSDFFTNNKWDKYYDKYVNTGNNTEYSKRILGDATGEMGPFASGPKSSWYDDYANFVYSSYPWFVRGGSCSYTSGAGVFGFGTYAGGTNANGSFRAVFAL